MQCIKKVLSIFLNDIATARACYNGNVGPYFDMQEHFMRCSLWQQNPTARPLICHERPTNTLSLFFLCELTTLPVRARFCSYN